MRGKVGKRILAGILSCSMVFSAITCPADASAAAKQTNAQAKQLTEKALKKKLAETASSKQYPKGLIAFGESQLTGAEGEDSELLIVRAGGTKGKAKVTLKAIGVSAKYGDDYLLTVEDGKKKTVLDADSNTQTLMEKYGESLTVKSAKEEEASEGADADTVDSKAAVEQTSGTAKLSELSGMRKAAAMQNGKVAAQKSWRETNDKKDSDYQKAEKLMTKGKENLLDAAKKMDGVEYTFTFAEGEYKKAVDISAIDDELSEGDEQVMFILSDASGAKLSESYTGYFNILDNEEEVPDAYEMAASSVKVKRGVKEVTLTVNKTEGLEKLSVLTVGTSAVTAKAGVDYESVNEALVFAPGMTSKEVTIPLKDNSDVKEDVSFYVGLTSEDGVVTKDKNATLVTITNDEQSEDVVTESQPVSKKAGKKASETTDPHSMDKTISSSGREASATVISGLDLTTASSVAVEFYSDEGSCDVKQGCSKVKKSDRRVIIKVGSRQIYSNTANAIGSRASKQTASLTLSDGDKVSSGSVTASVQPVNQNNNAKLHVTKVTVTYPGYTVSMDNSAINANGSIVNAGNAHQSVLYTGQNEKREQGNPFRLGCAYLKGAESQVLVKKDDALNLSYSYDRNSKTSDGITPNADNTTFKGYEVLNVSKNQWESFNGSKLGDLVNTTNKSKYVASGNNIRLRPKFEVKKAKLQFLNNGSVTISKSGGNVKVKQSDAGAFKGFNNNSTLSDATLLDSISIVGTPKSGYSVEGFSTVDTAKKKEVAQVKSSLPNEIKLVPQTTNTINIDIKYEESKISVMADPKGRHADKGSVLYVDPDNPSKTVSGNANTPMDVNGVMINSTYSIIGLANENAADENHLYRATWRDGTLDADKNGDITAAEQNAGKGYHDLGSSVGNVLSFAPSIAHTVIYYDFQEREKNLDGIDDDKIAYLMGRVSLKDRELFSNTTKTQRLSGVQVMADGDSTTTDGNGSYEMDGDGTYYVNDYMLVTFTYNAPDGSVMTANQISRPAYNTNLTFSTDSVMNVTSATASYVQTVNGKEEEKSIAWNAMDNGDTTYRLRFHVESKNNNLQPVKGILRFYTNDGTEIPDTAITKEIEAKDSGNFAFDFNPKTMKLAPGTTITFQVFDQQGTKYYERKTGIALMEAIGMLDFVNSFEFGGANTVISLIGNINSKFDLGWNGEFDAKSNENIVVDDEGTMTLSMGFQTGEISKEFGNVEKYDSVAGKATEKAEAQEKYINESVKLANKKGGPTADEQKKLQELKQQMTESAKALDDEIAHASNPKETKTMVGAGVNADVAVSLEISFGKDEEKSAYYFKSMVISASVTGGVDVNVNFATPIGITISLGFGLGVTDSGATFVIAENEQIGDLTRYYLTTGKEDSLIGEQNKIDLFNLDDPNYTHTGAFKVNPYIGLHAAVGVLSDMISVTVSGKAQFDMAFFTDDRDNSGSVNLSAEIGVKVLFISASWPFVSKDISLFGGGNSASTGLENLNYLHDNSAVLKGDSREYFKNRSKWHSAGVTVKSLDENENGVKEAVLKKGIYSGTDVQITALKNGDYLGVLLDDETKDDGTPARENSLNSAAVHYTIYDHETKKWSDPVLLEDDGTVDQDVSIFDLGDRGIMVTWSTANKKFTDETSRIDMMNAMDIHGAFFDKDKKEFGQPMAITQETSKLNSNSQDIGDIAGDVAPNVVYNNDSLIVYYTKNEYEVSDAAEGEVVGDVIYPAYSNMAYRKYKFSGSGTEGSWVTDYGDLNSELKSEIEAQAANIGVSYEDYVAAWYGQVLFETVPAVYLDEQLDDDGYWQDNKEPAIYAGNSAMSDKKDSSTEAGVVSDKKDEITGSDTVPEEYSPKIVDTDAISYNNLGLFAYTVDYDQSMTTVNDRDVYMQIYDFEEGTMSHPIMITSDNVSDAEVHFTKAISKERKLDDTYLTWLSDGNIVGLNISNAVGNDCLIKKTTDSGTQYYIIDKSRPENPEDPGYIPVMTLVESKDAKAASNTEDVSEVSSSDETDESAGEEEAAEQEVSPISGFDVKSADGYVYVSWTEQKAELKEGIEEGSEEAADASNQTVETQIYMARYDIAEGCMTGAVQVTSGEGANYDNLSFVVNDDATLTALATKTESKKVTAEEFNETIDDYNKSAEIPKSEQQEKVEEDDFVEYVAPDETNKTLVAMDITPVSVMKVSQASMDGLTAGEENIVSFSILNDGIDTLENAVLKITDSKGDSLLQEAVAGQGDGKEGVTEYQTVDSIKIPKLMGGNTYDALAAVKLGEKDTDVAITVNLTDASGNELINRTFEKSIEEETTLENLTVSETAERDVYDIAVDIKNSNARYAKEREASIGIVTADGNVELAKVPVQELARGEGVSVEKQVTVDSAKQFVVDEKDGAVTETGTFYVEYNGKTETKEIVRSATGEQMDAVNSIEDGKIGDGAAMEVFEGYTDRASANIKSSKEDASIGSEGTEGLQVIWSTEDEEIATVDDYGNVTGIKAGSTKLNAFVMPKNSEISASVNEEQDSSGYNFGVEESNYTNLPNAAIKKYTVELTVKEGEPVTSEAPATEAPATQTPASETPATQNPASETPPVGDTGTGSKTTTKKGVTYKVSGSSAAVSKVKSSVASVTIPATVKIGGKSYKVTKIAANAFKNQKKLKKAVIGKNVKTIGASAFYGCKKLTGITIAKSVTNIGAKAFYGCKSLKKVTFKRKSAPKIGKNAFKGIAAKATFKVPKKSKAKYKKVLKKKTGVTGKMKIKA